MSTSDYIATLALVIALLSAWISYSSHKHAVRVEEKNSALNFSREKSEFLARIDKARKCFDRLEKRLNDLIQKISCLPERKQQQLNHLASQLQDDLKFLKGCQRQAWSLWDETYEATPFFLSHQRPHFQELIESDEQFTQDAHCRCDHADKQISNTMSCI